MDCGLLFNDTGLENITFEETLDEIDLANATEKTVESSTYWNIKTICYSVLLPIILLVGCVGNSLNIVGFTRGRFRHTLDEIERAAATGLVALAISNLCFCVVALPAVIFTKTNTYGASTLWDVISVYYNTYRSPVINTILLCSTWLLCVVSLERYLSVCHPIRARWRIKVWKIIVVDCVILVFSISFNMPDFLKYNFQSSTCPNSCSSCYVLFYRQIFFDQTFKNVHSVLWMVIGAIVPLLLLAFCNCRLLLEIRRIRKLDRYKVTTTRHPNNTSKITVMLISVVFLYFILVCPSTVLSLLVDYVIAQSHATLKGYQIAVVITNMAQAIFFSVNFGLYCSISKPFRDSVSSQILCRRSSGMVSDSRNRYKAVAFHRA